MARLWLLIFLWTCWVGHAQAFAAEDAQPAGHAEAEHAKADHADADHAKSDHDDAGHGGPAPIKFPADFYGDLALWSGVTFLLFLFLLTKLAWKPLIGGMNERENKIRQDIADAESNRVKAESMLKDYETKLSKAQEEVRGIIAEARRDADQVKQDILATAEKESATLRQRAVADVEQARAQALTDIFEFASKNILQATEQVVGRSLAGTDHERLVREAMTNLDIRKN